MALLGLTGCKHDPNVQKQKYFESGQRYEKEGKLREAVIQFSNALKVDRNYSPAHYELAKTYLQLGSVIAGYQELQRTVALSPSNVQARLDLGTLLLAGGAPDRAREQVKAVLAAQPNNAEAYALLAKVDLKASDQPGALENIQHAISLDPNRAIFHTTLGLIQTQAPAEQATGLAELQKAVELDGKNAPARLALASVLAKKGDLPGAEQQAEAAVQSAPENLQARAVLAELYMRAGDKGKAEQTLMQAVDAMPDKAQPADLLLNFYLRTGQADRAEAVFNQLRQNHAKSVPVQVAYARVLVAKNEFGPAGDVLKGISKANANDPQVQRLNAELLLHEGKLHDAFTLLQKAAGSAPDDVRLQLLLGQTAQAVGNASVAEASYTEVLRLDAHNVIAQRGLAAMAGTHGDTAHLSQLAEKFITDHPDLPDGYIWRGSVEATQQQYEQAESDFQNALKRDPKSAIADLELGQLRIREKRVSEARPFLEQALAKDPNLTQALDLLVASDLQEKHPEKALALIQDQINKAPNNVSLYTDLSVLQLHLKDVGGAQASAQHALQLNKDYEPAVQAYSQVQLASGNTDGALATWQQWLNGHPNDARATMLMGTLEESKGDVSKAMDWYKKSLSLDNSQAVAANNLAYLMVENGENSDVALSYAQSARRSLPNSPSTADTLAWVYFHKGTFSLARDLLMDAEKADPSNASVHYHLGMTYQKLGDKTTAATELKKAAELAPNTQTGKAAQDALGHMG